MDGPILAERASQRSTIATADDAQAYYDFCRLRFEQQERNRDRFATRARQLALSLTALGSGCFFLVEALMTHAIWSTVLPCVGILVTAVGGGFVFLLFRSADYKILPSTTNIDQVWVNAEHNHRLNAENGHEISRKFFMLREFASGLNQASDHNASVDEKRQQHLDRAKQATMVATALFFAGIATLLAFMLSS